ncbi:ParA family protein (plasmid) [Pseudomonas shirazica]|nr:ParA family protein [Pseudomonas shirazica]
MKRTAVANQKGGVGKTTLEAHLACYAAEQGKRVLVLDLDESDLSQFFPLSRMATIRPTSWPVSFSLTSTPASSRARLRPTSG